MINPATGSFNEFSAPTPGGRAVGITAGSDGNLWFTGSGQIGMIDPTTDAITEYPVTPGVNQVAAGPDGLPWFTDTSNNAVGVASLSDSSFVVTQQPPSLIAAGTPFGVAVQAEDSSGNLVTSFDGTVTIALANNPGGATLGGTLTATASGGVATFPGLTITRAASGYTLYASGGGFSEGVTSPISVSPLAASQLAITQPPPATVAPNVAFGLQAAIEDRYGNVVTTATGTMSVAFADDPTGAKLGGTRTATIGQGVASFSNLTITKIGSGYTIRVSSSGFSPVVTGAINVTKTGASAAVVVQGASQAPTSLLAPLVLDSPDAFDTLGIKKRPRST